MLLVLLKSPRGHAEENAYPIKDVAIETAASPSLPQGRGISQGPLIGRTELQGSGKTWVMKESSLFSLLAKEKDDILLLGFQGRKRVL